MEIDAPIHANENNLPRVLGAGLPVLLVFWRRKCAPCDQLAPALDRLTRGYAGRAVVVKMDVEAEPGLLPRFDVRPIPTIHTDPTFDRAILESTTPVLVDFWAVWCGPCKAVAPVVADLAREFAGRALVAKLDVEANPRTEARFGVISIPTLLIFREGQLVDQIVGAQTAQHLRQRLARAARQ